MKKLLAIFKELGKAYNLPQDIQDQLDQILENDDAEQIDAAEVNKILSTGLTSKLNAVSKNSSFDKKKVQDDAYKSAERKIKSEVEEVLKDKFSLQESEAADLPTLVEEAAAKIGTGKPGKPGEITEDAVKKHPVYIRLEKKLKDDLDAEKKKGEDAVNTLKSEYEYKDVLSTATNKGLEIFTGMKPVLSQDSEVAKNQLEMVKDLISRNKFQVVDNQIIVLNADGSVMEDDFKNKVTFETFVKSVTQKYFDFAKADDRKSPNGQKGAKPGEGSGTPGKKYTGPMPKTQEEFNKMVFDEKLSLDERMEIQQYAEENPSAIAN